ncbi:MAG: tetratricopeptide repeat protein [Syntrophobacterales bacterium]|nr:tetratricopeptide repeat protein [Syntrophobacterales bacterium]
MKKINKIDLNDLYDQADQYIREKRYDEAIELYKKLIKMNPGNDSLILSLGWAYRDNGKLAEAIKCFENLLEKELSRKVFTGFAFDEMVRIFRAEGRYKQLIDVCERVVAAQPGDTALLHTLGDSCLKAGKTKRAIEIFELLTRMEPVAPMYFCCLGNAYVMAGNFTSANEAYENAIKIEPEETDNYYSKLGDAYLQCFEYERAENALKKALDYKFDYPLYHCNLGDVLVKQSRLDEAREAYENAIRIDPLSRGVYYNRFGNTLAREQNYPLAIELYEKAIDADPQNPFYYINLVDLCKSEGFIEKAKKAYEKAKSLKVIP